MKIFLLIFVVSSIEAQNSIELQFLGDSLSQEEATNRELCDTKYCLSDAKYLFYAATQNKSVRPCDDFKEFAVGTVAKYQTINDRIPFAGFLWDFQEKYYVQVKKVLSAPANVNDSRISKGLKTFFAKCVNSKSIRKNGVSEAREYMQSFGLKFYPEKNEKDFNLKKYIEQERTNALRLLFSREIDYSEVFNKTYLYLKGSNDTDFDLKLESYGTMLYDMNQIYRNSSFSEEFKKEFKEISSRQIEFYQQLKNLNSTVKNKKSSKWMTIDEINNLTSPLYLDWLTIINNQLVTKINSSAQILVSSPQSISKIAEFLAENDKDVIADFLVYDLLYELIYGFIVYVDDKYKMAKFGTVRTNERWLECQEVIMKYMSPTLDVLFLQRYVDKKTEDSWRKFCTEMIEFVLKKFKSINQWGEEAFMDVTEKLQSVKFIFGYSEDFVSAEMLEELYGDLDFDQNFNKVLHQMQVLHKKLEREPKIRKLLKLGAKDSYSFYYRLSDNIIFIDSAFLNYPFYHDQRPRYYNIATAGLLMFEYVLWHLNEYLNKKYNLSIPKIRDQLQNGYEFYESWLESGGEELNLGANRLTNRQLYWVAVARTFYRKHQEIDIPLETDLEVEISNELHKYISKNPGFKEAFDCKTNN